MTDYKSSHQKYFIYNQLVVGKNLLNMTDYNRKINPSQSKTSLS